MALALAGAGGAGLARGREGATRLGRAGAGVIFREARVHAGEAGG
jgi:hypothetical protein